jgi:hypothetical protein
MTKRDQSAAERFLPGDFDPGRFAPDTFDPSPSREQEIEELFNDVPKELRDDHEAQDDLGPLESPPGSRSLADVVSLDERRTADTDNPDRPKLSRAELALYREGLSDLIEAERAAGADQLQFD